MEQYLIIDILIDLMLPLHGKSHLLVVKAERLNGYGTILNFKPVAGVLPVDVFQLFDLKPACNFSNGVEILNPGGLGFQEAGSIQLIPNGHPAIAQFTR